MKQDPTQKFLASLPEITPGEQFWFACHPEVPCFNACCSDLNMPLMPYDVLRLCRNLNMNSNQFIEEYSIPGCYEDTGFPLLHLSMEGGPDKPCPFLTEAGCGVYPDRSAACRTYPLGRAVMPSEGYEQTSVADSAEIPLVERYFLVREGHCKGFAENAVWTSESWLADQGLEPYNRMNDRYMRLISRFKAVAEGAVLSEKHATMALLCLYQQDSFLSFIKQVNLFSHLEFTGKWSAMPREEVIALLEIDPEQRLSFAFDWLELALFGQTANLAPKTTG
jgi:Fe-S-cluster containining protein